MDRRQALRLSSEALSHLRRRLTWLHRLKGRWGRRTQIRLVAVAAALVLGAGLWSRGLVPPAERAEVIWQVDLGLFSALLTALTLVFAVTTTPQTRWPGLRDLILASGATSWLATASTSVLVAAGGDIWSSRGLIGIGMLLSVVQLGLGMDTLLVLMRFRSAAGRQALLAGLVTRRLHSIAKSGGQPGVAERPELAELREEIEYAINRGDAAELAIRVTEVVNGWPDDDAADQARYRLALLTHLLERLGRSMLYETLSGNAAGAVIPPLIHGALQTSWRLTSLTFPDRSAGGRTEVAAAVALGQVCRVMGWLQQCAHERLQNDPQDRGARQIINAVGDGRLRIVQYVDPDPPGFFRTAQDPWPYGFSDPTAALLWLAALCEFGGSHVGSGLYILCEVLSGEKFYGNYWNGDCVFTEIERRIGRHGERSPNGKMVCGGDLGATSLELAATVISGLRNRRFVPPEGRENDPNYSVDRRYLRSQLSMFATYDCLSGADAAIDWLAVALTSAPTHPSLINATIRAFESYCEPSRLPIRSLGERPAAVTLAALIRLTASRPDQARTLAAALPSPLIAGALQHARFVFTDNGTGAPEVLTLGRHIEHRLGPRRDQERELLSTVEGLLVDG